MPGPIDPFLTLAQANGKFLLKLAEIGRSIGEDYAAIGKQSFASVAEQIRTVQPGQIPQFVAPTEFLPDIEKRQRYAAEKAKTAYEDWQATWKDVVSKVEPANGLEAFQKLMAYWAKPVSPDKADA